MIQRWSRRTFYGIGRYKDALDYLSDWRADPELTRLIGIIEKKIEDRSIRAKKVRERKKDKK